MNKSRNFEDLMMSVTRILWESDYTNDFVASVLVDLGSRLQLMKENDEDGS